MRFPIVLCLPSLLFLSAATAHALPLQSNHGKLQAVPVVKPVVVDGALDEWDTSAEMLVYGMRKLRDRYSVRVSAMWDTEALYLGLQWRDPTPLINNVDVDAAPGDGWMADSFQGRFVIAGRQVHLTTCYSSKKDKSAAVIEYDTATNPAGRRVFLAPGKVTSDASGFAQAFQADVDARGYVQELRIPWSLLSKQRMPAPGHTFTFTGEYFWGGASGTTWPAVMWSDPINQKNPVRIVVYQNPGVWGEIELLAKGNLPRAAESDGELLLQGPLPLRFDVPADATHFTIVVEDDKGRRVRNLASHQRVSDYVTQGTGGTKAKVIEVPWDGRPDGEWDKDRMLFLGKDLVAAGSYTARCLVHRGVGVTFAGSFYNPGTPPWPTADGKGGWGFDHANPQAVAAMPKSSPAKGRVFLGWEHGEGGVGFIGLDADGRKLWEWLRRGVGATYIATSLNHAYFTFHSQQHAIGRVNPDNGDQVPFGNGNLDITLPNEATGLAVRDKLLAVSLAKQNVVLIFDAELGTKQREISVESPGSITIMPTGELLGVSGNGLFLVPPGAKDAQNLNALSGPLAINSDSAGRVFVSERERSIIARYNQIPINVTGQVPIIGEPGGHQPGPWNAHRMGNPSAIAIEERADGAVRLWVTENQLSPRRVSVWDANSGDFVKDYLGNTRYSGNGGILSDDIPDLGLVDGVMYRVDYKTGSYSPLEIMGGSPVSQPGKHAVFTRGMSTKAGASFGNGYHFFSNASGRECEYYIEAADAVPMVFMRRGDRWRCVAALGHAGHALPADLTKALSATSVFAWNDANDDGYQQPNEFGWHDVGQKNVLNGGWGYRCNRDLTFYHSGLAFRPARFSPDGVPVYDVAKAERLPGDLGQTRGDIHRTRFGYVASEGSGKDVDANNVVHGLHHLVGFDATGRRRWSYPNYWIAVHGAFTAPAAIPGVLMGVLKVTGVTPLDEAHSVISLRGNIGQEFLIRDDGLYIGELFTDQRMAPADLPPTRNIVGVPINETTLGGEPFNGWMCRSRDGKIRMTYGQTDVRIAEVVGLDRLQELSPQIVRVGEPELASARSFKPRREVVARTTKFDVPRGAAFTADPKLFESPAAIVIQSGREEVGRALLRWDDTSLHFACQVADSTPFVNKGSSAQLAFKSGDSVSLYISPTANNGGTRVLLASLRGKPTTVLYRPRGPGNLPFVFESPVRKSEFAFVAEEPIAQFQIDAGTGSYTLRASIPWSVLAITPRPNMNLSADVGLLFGDDTGANTTQRVHWVDRETNVVNDIPTEAEFSPTRWGTITLKP